MAEPDWTIGGCVMTSIAISVLSAAEFEIARTLMSELSAHPSYDDWIDCRYGTMMGRSLGGCQARLVTVSLGPFLEWCDDLSLRPSECALDAFALLSARDDVAHQTGESSAARVPHSIPFIGRKAKSSSTPHGPKSASRSIGVDL
jgi:hypothetical protein